MPRVRSSWVLADALLASEESAKAPATKVRASTPGAQAPLIHGPSSRLYLFVFLAALCIAIVPVLAVADAATQEEETQFSVVAGPLSFSTAPSLPILNSVTLNGQAQSTNTTMTNIGFIDATGSGFGWNVLVEGQSGEKKSAVFAQYCPKAKCGSDSEGYVGNGETLVADSLTLNSTGASFTAQNGSTGTAPTLNCSSACDIDNPSAVKVASAAVNAGMGTWRTTGFSARSLSLATPSTLSVPPNEEVFRVNLLWTLATGP